MPMLYWFLPHNQANFPVWMCLSVIIQEILQSGWLSVSTFKNFSSLNEPQFQIQHIPQSWFNKKKEKKGIQPNYTNSFKTNLFIRQWSTRILIKPQHWLLLLSLAIETQTFSVSVLVLLLRLRNTQSPLSLTESHWNPSRTTETYLNPIKSLQTHWNLLWQTPWNLSRPI